MKIKPIKKEIETFVVLLLFAVVVALVIKNVLYFESRNEQLLLAEASFNEPSELIVKNNPFNDLSLSAKAFFVWDTRDKKMLAGFNEETQFPLASLTKLMTALVASEISSYDAIVTIGQPDLNSEGDNGLRKGERWRLSDIIDFVLMSSSNDGARALASAVYAFDDTENADTDDNCGARAEARATFIKEMNKKAKKLGLTQSFYLNESGLDVRETLSGGYGSAKDTAILTEYILKEYPTLLEASAYKKMRIDSDILSHQVDNTNSIVESLPGIVASKTGFTDLAGGNLTVAFDMGIGHIVIVSVLGSTKEGRFSDAKQLIWASLKHQFGENEKQKLNQNTK